MRPCFQRHASADNVPNARLRKAGLVAGTADSFQHLVDADLGRGDGVRHILPTRSGLEHIEPSVIAGELCAFEVMTEFLRSVVKLMGEFPSGVQALVDVMAASPHGVYDSHTGWIAFTDQFGRGLAVVDPNRSEVLSGFLF
jgi:hypothetical protein